jgi:hypothetical protein
MGDPSPPAGALLLEQSEELLGIFGAGESLVHSIGFNTSRGRVYGPWGSIRGSPFAYAGVVYGIYGGEKWGCVGAIGVWVALLAPPSGPPSVTLPSPPPPPTRGTSKSPRFGASSGVDTVWDDGPSHGGKPCQSLHVQLVCHGHSWSISSPSQFMLSTCYSSG